MIPPLNSETQSKILLRLSFEAPALSVKLGNSNLWSEPTARKHPTLYFLWQKIKEEIRFNEILKWMRDDIFWHLFYKDRLFQKIDCNLNKYNGMIIVVIDFEKHANWENFDNSWNKNIGKINIIFHALLKCCGFQYRILKYKVSNIKICWPARKNLNDSIFSKCNWKYVIIIYYTYYNIALIW